MRIEQRRSELGLTQDQLAGLVRRQGVEFHQTAVDKIEKRDSKRPRYLKELAVALNVNEDWLLKGREPKERSEETLPRDVKIVPIVSWVSAGALSKPDVSDEQIGVVRIGDLDPRGDWLALKVDGVAFVEAVTTQTASIHADEASHWDRLHDTRPVSRINHSEAYCHDGACTNQAESYFSRLRRMVSGQHHHVSPRYLHQYAAQAAWLEDHRRTDNGGLVHRTLFVSLSHPVSRDWKGYWQRLQG